MGSGSRSTRPAWSTSPATASTDFPKKNPYQSTLQGGADAFVTKLNPSAISAASLLYSTYLGGSGDDAGVGIAVTADNYVYVTGYTDSANFPTLHGPQTNQGGRDAFVVKLQPGTASQLVYATYVGGGGRDEAYGIALGAEGNAYITGLRPVCGPSVVSAFATAGGLRTRSWPSSSAVGGRRPPSRRCLRCGERAAA